MIKGEKFKEKQKLLNKRKKQLKKRITKSEKIIANLFKEIKIKAIFQKGFIGGSNFCIVDFYLPAYGICFEVDGGYHNTPEQKKRDQSRDRYLVKHKGFTVIHITNDLAAKISSKELWCLIKNHEIKRKSTYHSDYKCPEVVYDYEKSKNLKLNEPNEFF